MPQQNESSFSKESSIWSQNPGHALPKQFPFRPAQNTFAFRGPPHNTLGSEDLPPTLSSHRRVERAKSRGPSSASRHVARFGLAAALQRSRSSLEPDLWRQFGP